MRLSDLHPRRFFFDAWRDFDAEATAYRAARTPAEATSDALLALYVFAVVAISLVLQEYLGDRLAFFEIAAFVDAPRGASSFPALHGLVDWLKPANGTFSAAIRDGGYFELWVLGYWASWRVIGFLILPALAIAFVPRLRREPLGLSFAGMRQHLWIYAVLFLPVLTAVFVVSFTEEFSTYYPFYVNAHRSLFDFAVWETFYIAQFLSLEFFFRGFMLQPLRRIMGSPAIFAMVVPYVMIHIGKPILECFAAIIAGVVLGTLAMRTRSIWSGFLIHVSVALSMDLLAIWQVHG